MVFCSTCDKGKETIGLASQTGGNDISAVGGQLALVDNAVGMDDVNRNGAVHFQHGASDGIFGIVTVAVVGGFVGEEVQVVAISHQVGLGELIKIAVGAVVVHEGFHPCHVPCRVHIDEHHAFEVVGGRRHSVPLHHRFLPFAAVENGTAVGSGSLSTYSQEVHIG